MSGTLWLGRLVVTISLQKLIAIFFSRVNERRRPQVLKVAKLRAPPHASSLSKTPLPVSRVSPSSPSSSSSVSSPSTLNFSYSVSPKSSRSCSFLAEKRNSHQSFPVSLTRGISFLAHIPSSKLQQSLTDLCSRFPSWPISGTLALSFLGFQVIMRKINSCSN